MLRLIITLFTLFGFTHGLALDGITLECSQIETLPDQSGHDYIKWLDQATDQIDEVWSQQFAPLPAEGVSFNRKRKAVWAKLTLRNNSETAQDYYLSFGNHEFLDLYRCQGGDCKLLGRSGHLIPPKDKMIDTRESFLLLTTDAQQTVEYFVRIESYQFSEARYLDPKLYDFRSWQNITLKRQISLSHIILTLGLFLGSFFAFFIYPVNLYITNKKPYYLFYALHISVVIFALLLRSEIDLELNVFFANHPNFWFGFYHASALFSIPFYILFVDSFLDLRIFQIRFYRLLRSIFWINVALILLALFVFFVLKEYYLSHDIVLAGKAISMLAGLVCFFVLVKGPRSAKYLAIGTLFLVAGAAVTNIMRLYHISTFDQVETTLFNWNLLYVHTGIFMEFIFFSLALGYNQHLLEEEKEIAIRQLKENEAIQEDYKIKLESDVKEQTNNILKIIKTLEKQERAQLESEFNKKLVDMELKALRAQMNPHFIFNSMNSIKHLIQKKDDERALDYLTRFSRLLRKSLQNASLQVVTLQEELDFCKLYLEIESLRFDDGFEFNLSVDAAIDTSFIVIPPLLLQPYLENSLWHGLMHKPGDRQLNLMILHKPDLICEIVIDDNGIGRDAAEQIKGARDVKHKSLGMSLTLDRLKLSRERLNMDITVEVMDKVDSNGASGGTEVHLYIKNL